MKIRSLVSCITTFKLTQAVIISWLLLVAMPAQAHDSCPADDPTPDHPETHPHCNPDKPGGNGNGGTGSPEEILGTEGDDGGGPDLITPAPTECVDLTLTTAVDGNSGTSDDILKGLAGNDCLVGIEIVPGSPLPDPGDDWGNDRFEAGDGNDWMQGGAGNDVFSAGQGYDVMLGNGGDDTFFAAGDADYVDGGAGWDIMNFNVNGSQLRVNWDSVAHPIDSGDAKKCDELVAAEGYGPYAANTITDVIDPDNPIVDQVFRVEDMHGTPYADIIFGSDADEASSPHRGDDCIDLGGGDDHLFGDRGNDVLIGGPGSDIMRGGEHKDQFHFYLADFLAGGEADVIEEFSLRHDCIELNDITGMGIISLSYPDDGGSDALDTKIQIDPSAGISGSILLWDVHLDASDLGCTGP